MDQQTIEYSLLAGNSYRSSRPTDGNKIPTPTGWTPVRTRVLESGFEAVAYLRGAEVVISYAGTYFSDNRDLVADAALGLGFNHQQIIDAAVFYEDVKKEYGPNITLTGHSLGGGLAATIGVFFNRPAVTFDPAPFRLLATKSNADEIAGHLRELGYPVDNDLTSFATIETTVALALPQAAAVLGVTLGVIGAAAYVVAKAYPTVIRGEEKIVGYALDGELLTSIFGNTDVERNLAAQLKILGSPLNIISHKGMGSIRPSELHSIALLIAVAREPRLATLPERIPGLYAAFIDPILYGAPTDKGTVNFIERLINNEFGAGASAAGRGVLARFADDLTRLTTSPTGTASQMPVQKALTVAAMEYYYFNDAVSTTSLFAASGGAINFDLANIGAALTSLKSPGRLRMRYGRLRKTRGH